MSKIGANVDAPTTPEGLGGPAAPATPPQKRPRTRDGGLQELEVNIDDVLDQLIRLRKRPPQGQSCYFPLETVVALCEGASRIFGAQDMLLDLEAPLHLCGDIHGQFHDLLRIFDAAGYPPTKNYLFLGDYVDRGKKSLEVIFLLFAYKIKYPDNFFLLRGNHESPSICRIYGFYDECKHRYNIKIWKTFCDVFNVLPACAVISDRVICMHGGLSQQMLSNHMNVKDMVNNLLRPADIPDQGFLCDLLWSDPDPEINGFGINERGVSVSFGTDVVQQFLHKENMDLVVRAHQVVSDGYEFFADRRLVTLFSAPNYCGEFDNAAAVLAIDDKLTCSFTVLQPDQAA